MTTILQYSDVFSSGRSGSSMDNVRTTPSNSGPMMSNNYSLPTNNPSTGDFWKSFGVSSNSSNNTAGRTGCDIHVSEEVKFAVAFAVERFLRRGEERELDFPSSFTSVERAYVHKLARAVGLKSKSGGNGINRALTVFKPDLSMLSQKAALFTLTWNSRRAISQLIQTNPVTGKEKVDLQPRTDRSQGMDRGTREERQRSTTGKLMGAVPQIPPPRTAPCGPILVDLAVARRLPVWEKRAEIVRFVTDFPVMIVAAPPGSGKTTQIPQMLMEEWAARGQRCRMICTQPRRLAAHSNAERVAAERGETVGQTVGYQIRLESKVSPRTLLTFCTNSVLLRTLYADSHFLAGTTHILVDEIHERDRHADLLLMVLRGLLKTHRHLRLLLLMSNGGLATLSPLATSPASGGGGGGQPAQSSVVVPLVDLYQNYFDHCPLVLIPSRSFDVREFFLEDILKWLDYWTEDMDAIKHLLQKDCERRQVVRAWIERLTSPTSGSGSSGSQSSSSSPSSSQAGFPLVPPPPVTLATAAGLLHSGLEVPPSSAAVQSRYSAAGDSPSTSVELDEETKIMENRGLPLQRTNPALALEVDRILWDIWCSTVPPSSNFPLAGGSCCLETADILLSSGPGSSSSLQTLLDLVASERVPPDHQHSASGLSLLMICAARGHLNAVDQLLALGSNPFLRSPAPRPMPACSLPGGTGGTSLLPSTPTGDSGMTGMTALDWAVYFRYPDTARLIYAHMKASCQIQSGEKSEASQLRYGVSTSGGGVPKTCSPDSDLLTIFLNSLPHEHFTDYNVIFRLIKHVDDVMPEGSILVFLPTYDDVVNIRELLLDADVGGLAETGKHMVYILHSRMLVADLKRVFALPPPGVRKIVLSTNISESSLTLDDIVYVIDTGRERKKMFDNVTGSMTFRSEWISQTSVAQRKARAGRCSRGVCYHLFSRYRYESMMSNLVPEIRTYPLEELCLQSKLLAPPGYPIPDYLAMVVEPPSFLTTRNSVKMLKEMGALDMFDDLTELGYHLCDLPIEPRYGKMVLCSVALKCLDPILTIACILSYSEPFTIPSSGMERREAMGARRKFAADTSSDHMVILRAFQFWQKARSEGWEKSFCQKNFISAAAFEIITGIRTQLLGQLRASGFVKARGSGDIRDLNANSENWAVVKAALVAGMYANLVRFDRDHLCLVSTMHTKVRFHPQSVLACSEHGEALPLSNLQTDWLLYDEAVVVGGCAQIRCCTLVSPITVALLGGQSRLRPDLMRETENAIYDLQSGQQQQQQSSNMQQQQGGYNDFASSSTSTVSSSHQQQQQMSVPPNSSTASSLQSGTSNPSGMSSTASVSSTAQCGGGGGLSSDSESEEDANSAEVGKRVPLRLDDFLHFRLDCESAQMVLQLRHKWHALFLRRLRSPGKQCTQQDEAVLRSLVTVLTSEEQTLGLRQPSGVGARPRPMAAELCNQAEYTMGSPICIPPPTIGQTSLLKPSSEGLSQTESTVDHHQSGRETPASALSSMQIHEDRSAAFHSPPVVDRAVQSLNHSMRYFLVRFTNRPQLELAVNRDIYAVSRHIEHKIGTAYQEGKTVYLIFLSDTNSCFYGYARVKQPLVGKDRPVDIASQLEDFGLFIVEWIRRLALPYTGALALTNPWTGNNKLHMSKDGQELEPFVGDRLISLLRSNVITPQSSVSTWPPLPGSPSNVPPTSVQSGPARRPPPPTTSIHPGLSPHHPPPPPSLWIARTPPGAHTVPPPPHHGFAPAPPHMAPPPPYGPPPPPPFPGVACYGGPPQSPGMMFSAPQSNPAPPPQPPPPPHHHPQAPGGHHLIFRGLPPTAPRLAPPNASYPLPTQPPQRH